MARQASSGALGFNNYPADFRTPMGNDRSGQFLAQGINQGVAGVVQAMEQKAAERKAKDEEKRMREALGPMIEQMSNGRFTVGDVPKEGLPILFNAAQQMQKEQQEAPLKELQMQNAQLRNTLLELETKQRQNPPPSRIGEVISRGGQDYIYTQEGNLSPLGGKQAQDGPGSGLGKLVEDLDRARASGNPQAVKALEAGVARAVESRAPRNPLVETQRMALQEEMLRLESAIAKDQGEIAKDDKRTGFLNLRSRQARIDENARKLAEIQQRLQMMGGGAGMTADEFFQGL